MRVAVAMIVLAVVEAGCATPYQRYGARGGYYDLPMGRNLALVSFQGNSYTSEERIRASLLYRCAEVTEAHGYDFFVIRDRQEDSAPIARSNPPAAPGAAADSSAYRKAAIIEMLTRKEADAEAYDARRTLQYLGPQLGLSRHYRGLRASARCARSAWAYSTPASR